ncbi:MAG: hypothetical protein H0U27_00475 [Nitrosopumilus sp.]|nr:hypothetical protein [Nitrosopumilus sp.]
MDEVMAMLTEYHKDHFLILNLSEKKWEYSKANYQVSYFPPPLMFLLISCAQIFEFGFPDHHPPALFLMFKILLAMDKWMKADPYNVVIVHCKVFLQSPF